MSPDAKQPSSGAVLGSKVLRYSGIQGGLLATSNLLTFASVAVVAFFLGPADFGRFGLLLFLAGLLTTLFNLATKQGTLKRVFGMDDEDEDDDDADDSSAAAEGDRNSLGTGIDDAHRLGPRHRPRDRLCRADRRPPAWRRAQRSLIAFAAITGGPSAIFRLASLVLWLERRPGPHVAVEVARPLLTLGAVVAFVASGRRARGRDRRNRARHRADGRLRPGHAQRQLRRSPDLHEAIEIWKKGAPRIPIVLSMFTISQADIFLLSRFVSDADLGIYQLA